MTTHEEQLIEVLSTIENPALIDHAQFKRSVEFIKQHMGEEDYAQLKRDFNFNVVPLEMDL